MKIQELIEQLKHQNPTLEVICYEEIAGKADSRIYDVVGIHITPGERDKKGNTRLLFGNDKTSDKKFLVFEIVKEE